MATKSFTDTYVIERKDVNQFHNIMRKKPNIKLRKVKGHKDVKGTAILQMLNIHEK